MSYLEDIFKEPCRVLGGICDIVWKTLDAIESEMWNSGEPIKKRLHQFARG